MKCLIFQSFESLRSFGLARKQAKAGEGYETARRFGREQFSFARATKAAMLRRLIYIYKVVRILLGNKTV